MARKRGRGKTSNFSQAQVDALTEVLRGLLSSSKERQADLAERIGVSQQTISRVKAGREATGLGYGTATAIVREAGLGALDDFFRSVGVYETQLEIRDRKGDVIGFVDEDLTSNFKLKLAVMQARAHKVEMSLIRATIQAKGGPTAQHETKVWLRFFLEADAVINAWREEEDRRVASPASSSSLPEAPVTERPALPQRAVSSPRARRR